MSAGQCLSKVQRVAPADMTDPAAHNPAARAMATDVPAGDGDVGQKGCGKLGQKSDLGTCPRATDVFSLMPADVRDKCIGKMRVLTFEAGKDIIEQNTIGTAMYFLDCGSAAATMSGRVVNSFTAGDFFGEVSFLATAVSVLEGEKRKLSIKRTATVTALEPCRCLSLGVKDFFDVYGKDTKSLKAILTVIGDCAQARISATSEAGATFQGFCRMPTVPGQQHIMKAAKAVSSGVTSASRPEETDQDRMLMSFMCAFVKTSAAMGLLDCMDERSRMHIVTRMTQCHFKSGEQIVAQGTIGKTLYLIDAGTALAVSGGTVLEELPEGSFFGEIAFLVTCARILNLAAQGTALDQLRTCDVFAKNDVSCWELPVNDFVEVCVRVYVCTCGCKHRKRASVHSWAAKVPGWVVGITVGDNGWRFRFSVVDLALPRHSNYTSYLAPHAPKPEPRAPDYCL
jgi:CRP-like cAMP-binding protein